MDYREALVFTYSFPTPDIYNEVCDPTKEDPGPPWDIFSIFEKRIETLK